MKIKTNLILNVLIYCILISCSNREGKYCIELCATNDLHGRYFDSLYTDNQANKHSLANVSAHLKNLRREIGEKSVLLIDVGDALQGDNAVFYSNYIDTAANRKHLFTRVSEYLEYDALVVGNHDIETGHKVYDKIADEISIPYLAANAIDQKSGKCYFEPYKVFDKNGVKVAVIGMTNPNIKKWLGEELWSGIDFLPIEELAIDIIDELRNNENPDIVILAIHGGLGNGESEGIENPARYLAAKLQGVDIILASHDHQTACEKIWNGKDSVLVMDGSNRAKYLVNAKIECEYADNKLISKKITGSLIPMENTPIDTVYRDEFRSDFIKTKEFTNQVIGKIESDIFTRDAFFGSSDYMDIVHTVQLSSSNADISLAAPLTYNGKVKAGVLKYNDLFTIYPYENSLYVVKMTGEQIKNYLEYSYDTWIETMKSPADHIMNIRYNEKRGGYSFVNISYNFDSAAGIDYEVDVTKPLGERVIIKSMLNGEMFDNNKTYNVALSSYRANGGGDLLTKGASIDKDDLEGIVLGKFNDIRSLIYDFYMSGNDKNIIKSSWKFIPEKIVAPAIKRDRSLLFGN